MNGGWDDIRLSEERGDLQLLFLLLLSLHTSVYGVKRASILNLNYRQLSMKWSISKK
jgi:hypothetical protein